MKISAIIAEYNPFHSGHALHIYETCKSTPESHIICVMSGNFVQRGGPAIADKWARAKMALSCGADMVVELPFLYATQPAEGFAAGAVRLIHGLNCVDSLSFGSECGDLALLECQARQNLQESAEYRQAIRRHLAGGSSFPRALSRAVAETNGQLPSTPNDILALEYLRALRRLGSDIAPICVTRRGGGYNDAGLHPSFSSATALRAAIAENGFSAQVLANLPAAAGDPPFVPLTDMEPYFRLVLFRLRNMPAEEIARIHDVAEGLEYRIKKAADRCESPLRLIPMIKTKRYTYARISRILLHCLLGVTKETIRQANETIPCARVLGFRKGREDLLSYITKNSNIPVAAQMPACPEGVLAQFDIRATELYAQLGKKIAPAGRDYTQKIIIV